MERMHIHLEGEFRVLLDFDTSEYVAHVKIHKDSMDLNIGKGKTPAEAMMDALTP